jgi:hypothetical protein
MSYAERKKVLCPGYGSADRAVALRKPKKWGQTPIGRYIVARMVTPQLIVA